MDRAYGRKSAFLFLLALPLLLVGSNTHPLQPPSVCRGLACNSQGCYPVEISESGSGLFYEGGIDLTGDGTFEQVRRVQERVFIYHDGVEVWQSPPKWRVSDLALGDPNDDGRSELILALWKQDETGVLRSHPFVVGYRGGIYRVLWGGSAVGEPIHEVELGDVDGEGTQELIVLEGQATGPDRAVTVWRWHGWGFRLLWRSPVGRYEHLLLIPGTDTGRSQTIGITVKQ